MTKKLLRNKNYMLVILGNFVSLMGSNIQQFVLSLYVLAITGSATLFATMLAISILPRIILSPFAGVFADWFDKKKSVVILDLVNAVILAVFAVYMFINAELSIGLIFVLVISLEITEVFFGASMSVILPSVVDKEEYLEANSLRSMILSVSHLLAPVLGALIYGFAGLYVVLAINAISFFLSAISEMFITVPKTESENNVRSFAGFKKDFVSGLKIIKDSKAIKTIIIMAVFINFSVSPFFSVGLIYVVKEVLLQSDFRFGLLQAILSSSMLLAPLLLTKSIKNMKLSNVLVQAFMLTGLLILIVSMTTQTFLFNVGNGLLSYLIIVVACFIIGMVATVVNISIDTLLQQIVPLEYMGRTSTVLRLFAVMAIPIGQVLFGLLYDLIDATYVMLINGSIILLVVFSLYSQIHHVDQKEKKDIKQNINEREVLANEV